MTIFNIIVCGFLFRVIGGGFWKIERYVPICLVLGLVVVQHHSSPITMFALMWLFAVIRLLPTAGLFSLTHNEPLERREGTFIFLYEWTMRLWKKLPRKFQSWYIAGFIYSVLRAGMALPAMVYLGNYIFLLQGVLYYIAGKLVVSRVAPSVAEVLSGMVFGWMI